MMLRYWARWQIARSDVHYFFRNLVYTLDEHDAINPIKRYPYDKKYLQYLIEMLRTTRLLFIPKSRQILATWTCVAFYLHDAIALPGRLNFVQSKKESDSGALLDRADIIYDNLGGPEQRQIYNALKPKMLYTRTSGRWQMRFPDHRSQLWAIQQGPDVIRQYTLSNWLCDEGAFQEHLEQSLKAAMPALTGGGRAAFPSTPNGMEIFYAKVHGLS